jgi:protein O-mannosyl-transferase
MAARDEVSAHLERLVRRPLFRSPWLWALAVALFTLFVYRRSPSLAFVFEDETGLLRSDAVRTPFSIARAFSTDLWGAPRGASWATGVYRPVTSLAWALLWRLGSGNAWLFHSVNALLHALAAALVVRFTWGRFATNFSAVAAGCVFAAHTLHTDAVFPATGLGDILALLSLAAVYALHGHARAPRAAAPIAFFFGVCAHEMTLLALPLVMLRDARDHRPARDWPARYAGYLASVIVYGALRARAIGAGPVAQARSLFNPLVDASLAQRLCTAARTLGRVTRITMAPLDLMPDYAPGAIVPSTRFDADVALGLVIAAVLVGVIVWAWRRRHALGDAAAWTLLAGLVTLNIPFVLERAFSEHQWYLASAGACVLFGAALGRVRMRLGLVAASGALLAVLGTLSMLTAARYDVWASTEMLMLDASQVERNSALAQVEYGEIHTIHGAPYLALRRCRHAARVMPRWAEPWGCIARALERQGKFAEAHAAYATMLSREGVTLFRRTQHIRFIARDGHAAEALEALAALERRGPWSQWHRLHFQETRALVMRRSP